MARGAPSSWTAAAVRSLLRRVSELEVKVKEKEKEKEQGSFQWNVYAQDFIPTGIEEDILIGDFTPPEFEPHRRPETGEKLEDLCDQGAVFPFEFMEEEGERGEEVKEEKMQEEGALAPPPEEKKKKKRKKKNGVTFASAEDERQAGEGDEPAQHPEARVPDTDSDADDSAAGPATPQPVDSPRAAAGWARAHRQLARLPYSSGASLRSVQAEVGPEFHVWPDSCNDTVVSFVICWLGGDPVGDHGHEDAEGDSAACAAAPPECLSAVAALRKRIDILLLALEERPDMFSDFGTAVRLTRSSHDWINTHADPDPEDVKKRVAILDRLVSSLMPGAAPQA